MIRKSLLKGGRSCRVTFTLPTNGFDHANLVGEFNDWNEESLPLARRKDGHHAVTLLLKTGHEYRFRYLLDGKTWTNDEAPDALVPNPFGSEDSVLKL
jgi:1,4-alpha-glucan branching enzyme